jgi:hypothetical protein
LLLSLRNNAKIVIAEQGISPTLLLGSLPVDVSSLPVNVPSEKGTQYMEERSFIL